MEALLKIGFRKVGDWILHGGRLDVKLSEHAPHRNTLYVFVIDGKPVYVGKTTQTLLKRLKGYIQPGSKQVTNTRNKADLVDALSRGQEIEIFILPDEGLVRYGEFDLNLAAALEDSIIRVVQPPWNWGRKDKVDGCDASLDIETVSMPYTNLSNRDLSDPAEIPAEAVFSIRLENAYFSSGFFNVGVGNSKYFGADGERLEIFLGSASEPVIGMINRTANRNNTPRLMGYIATRDWLQQHVRRGDRFWVRVLSPVSINIVTRYPGESQSCPDLAEP